MDANQIRELFRKGIFPRGKENPRLIETHANWIILAGNYAYKIKRPVKFSFLDYSTPSLRKHYCEEEVRLNRRLTDIYLGVEPVVRLEDGRLGIGLSGEVVDHAVLMHRLDPARQMHTLLQRGDAHSEELLPLAQLLARFHRHAERPASGPTSQSLFDDYIDLLSVQPMLTELFGPVLADTFRAWTSMAETTLDRLQHRISQRFEEGFVVDGHGDLHTANIFLMDKPVVFDCIEFNEHFRINEVLSEMAFLVMDIERYGRRDLSKTLFDEYQKHYPLILQEADEWLFEYFLFYRATVRLKIAALRAMDILKKQPALPEAERAQLRLFMDIAAKYAAEIRRRI